MVFPTVFFSQTTFDFKTAQSNLGWVKAGGANNTTGASANGMEVQWNANKSPKIRMTDANIDAAATPIVAVTLKNNSPEVRVLKLIHFKGGTGVGNKYINRQVLFQSGTAQTHYYDLTHTQWVNYDNGDGDSPLDFDFFEIGFQDVGNVNLATASTSGNVTIEKIEFLTQIPEIFTESFLFDTENDCEAWDPVGTSLSVNNSVLTMNTTTTAFAKIVQKTFSVNADINPTLFVKISNQTTNNQLILRDENGTNLALQSIGNDVVGSYSEYNLNVSDPLWVGTMRNLQIVVNDTQNGYKTSAGIVDFEYILFSNSASLGGEKMEKFASKRGVLYPNPVKDLLSIKSKEPVQQIVIHNLIGQQVATILNSNKINLEHLPTGMYTIAYVVSGEKLKEKFIKN